MWQLPEVPSEAGFQQLPTRWRSQQDPRNRFLGQDTTKEEDRNLRDGSRGSMLEEMNSVEQKRDGDKSNKKTEN